MQFSLTRTAMLLGQPRDAVRSLMLPWDTCNDQKIATQPKDHEESTSTYQTSPPLRCLIKTKVAAVKERTANKQGLGQSTSNTQDEGTEPRRPSKWSNIVEKCISAKTALARRGTKRLGQKNKHNYEPNDSVIRSAIYPNTESRSVQYRDIDLGSRREVIYVDTLVDLNKNNQVSEFEFDLSSRNSLYPCHNEYSYDEASSDTAIGIWEGSQHATGWPLCDRSAGSTLYRPLPPLSIISEQDSEDFSRPTTSSTDRRDSGEFLRHLQTDSSAPSMLHSRNVSDASAITAPPTEDGYDLRRPPTRNGPPLFERMTEHGAWPSKFSHNSTVVESRPDCDLEPAGERLVDRGDAFEDITWLQAPQYGDFEWYEVNDDFQESFLLETEEQAETRFRNNECESYMGRDSQKSLCFHFEQPPDEDDQSSISTTLDEPVEVITRSYGKFDAAFTQQIKDYSKLLDDLADPDATAQALELVSSRLSLLLNNSRADVSLRHPNEAEMSGKRQQMDLSDLDAFLDDDDDDDDADSGFELGTNTKVFACPAKPRPTPFSDLEQFISDDDLDFDITTGGLGKPVIKDFANWELSAGDDGEEANVLLNRTMLRARRPELRRAGWQSGL